MDALPDWPELEGIRARDWGLSDMHTYAAKHAPRITFARFDHAFDDVQDFFAGSLGSDADELVAFIDQNEADIQSSGVELASCVAPGTDHTILGHDAFYVIKVDGIRFVDWIRELVEGGTPEDVHCTDCH